MAIDQEENKKVIQRFHEALNEMDYKRIEELLADDATMGQPGQPRTQGSKKITAKLAEDLKTTYKIEALQCEILDLGTVGPYVIDERVDWAKVTGEEKEQGYYVSGSYLVENGKILDWTEWVSGEVRTRT